MLRMGPMLRIRHIVLECSLHRVTFSKETSNIASLKRAAYKHTDKCAVEFLTDKNEIACVFQFKNEISEDEFSQFVVEFRSDVLDEDLRNEISIQTEPIRNLILAHAFSKTGLDGDV